MASGGRVVLVVEDRYAKRALELLLGRRGLHCFMVLHLPVCSAKMTRIVSAHLRSGRRVVILVDAELGRASERERSVREKHRLGGDVEVIAIDPCMEALACTALGLRGCRDKPCNGGPVRAVNEYWRRIHRRDYEKRFLPQLLLEADNAGSLEKVDEFRRLLGAVAKACRQ
ncbi:hypothetical protein Pyrde_1376 [Pyrodictium delaneyi]|uniref:Uncharacterized protein n=1 Tax=Pyrodictium delaneyi TaxID=1273541 RepID=A0A0P0N3Y6_9CREN|nr:hypothetical protein [Pyrodictium delaneyi]ALL01422.1 hypothetical protein Pyrde_1376 [Pyrodictium delaneyi]OWJ54480.1 hypothetical protein Pdsh_06695 [Pyrodictium delaneyi]OWJ54660.1 hypothetical protein Pdsh_06480 [Pyrodictium delaneyi]